MMDVAAPPQRRIALSDGTRATLDVVRVIAAAWVVLNHLAVQHGWAHGAGAVFRLGQEAVIVFFLLSGFVIFANEHHRIDDPRGYYGRRLRRIYPTLLVALLVSTLVALDNGDLAARFSWRELAGTLLSLQDLSTLKPGVVVDPYLGNQPLWSLSYEVAFYLIFPVVHAAWRRWPRLAGHGIGLGCCLCYAGYALWPGHVLLVAAYFLLWWAGAMAAAAYGRGARTVTALWVPLLWLAVLALVAAAVVAIAGYRGVGVYPVLPLRHIAVAGVLMVLGFGAIGRWAGRISVRVARPAAFLASISYGVYVLHYPLLVQWQRSTSAAGLVAAFVLLAILATLADRELARMLARRAPAPPRTTPGPLPVS